MSGRGSPADTAAGLPVGYVSAGAYSSLLSEARALGEPDAIEASGAAELALGDGPGLPLPLGDGGADGLVVDTGGDAMGGTIVDSVSGCTMMIGSHAVGATVGTGAAGSGAGGSGFVGTGSALAGGEPMPGEAAALLRGAVVAVATVVGRVVAGGGSQSESGAVVVSALGAGALNACLGCAVRFDGEAMPD